MNFRLTSGLLIAILIISSCSRNKYSHSFEADRKYYFSEGSWLVNHPEVDMHVKAKKELTDLILKRLKNAGGNYIYFIENIKPDTLDPAPPRFNISEARLQQLGETVFHDYLINTRVRTIENDGKIEIDIVIYNIETGEKVYSQESFKNIPFSGVFLSSKRLGRNIRKSLSVALKEFEKHAFSTDDNS